MKGELYGLILAGGKSVRMGRDKGAIRYFKKEQRYHSADLLSAACDQVFISLRKGQLEGINPQYQYLTDTEHVNGPMNGILSAHKKYPSKSWFVLACDLPMMDFHHIEQLVKNREEGYDAVSFSLQKKPMPEPVCAIWEKSGLEKLAKSIDKLESSCPRKFLINSKTKLVFPKDEQILLNANYPIELEKIKTLLNQT